MSDSGDEVLLDHWRAGDRGAGDALLSRHLPSLGRFLRNKAGADADDLIQRTLLACTESCGRIRGDSAFRTYLFAVARHEAYRHFHRRTARRAHVDLDLVALRDPSGSAVEALIQLEQHAALHAALEHLSEDDRALLDQFYTEGLDSRTLAGRLGLRPSAVRARLHRARATLRQALTPRKAQGAAARASS